MGNSLQNQMSYGAIFLRTDKPFNVSGETVTGTVFINVIKPNFPGHVVYLKLKGKEHCNWEERKTSNPEDLMGNTGMHEIQQGKNVFYCHKIVLYKFEESTLPVGQFALPFKFTLNEYLPGSYDDNDIEFMASIKYKLKAEIESGKRNINTIKHSQQLIVREQFKIRKVDLGTGCASKEGYKIIIYRYKAIPHQVQARQSDLPLWREYNTKCAFDVNKVTAVLRKIVILQSSQGKVRVFRKDIQIESLQGPPAYQKAQFQITLALAPKDKEKANEEQEETIQPCTKGYMIKCSYSITVQSVFTTWFCAQPCHSINLPLNIVASGVPNWESVPQPKDWNPKTISVIDQQQKQAKFVIFSPNDMYDSPAYPFARKRSSRQILENMNKKIQMIQ